MIASELEIQRSYKDPAIAQNYCQIRFANEVMALLHKRQVKAVQEVMRLRGRGGRWRWRRGRGGSRGMWRRRGSWSAWNTTRG
jgi:hypothetical protein